MATASGREPVVLGKPARTLWELVARQTGAVAERTCMVGDRLDTDMAFAHVGGLHALLVLTGVTHEAHIASAPCAKADEGVALNVLNVLPSLADIAALHWQAHMHDPQANSM